MDTIRDIVTLDHICDAIGADVELVRGKGRKRNLVYQREIIAYLLYHYFHFSLSETARIINRSHSYVFYLLKRYNSDFTYTSSFKQYASHSLEIIKTKFHMFQSWPPNVGDIVYSLKLLDDSTFDTTSYLYTPDITGMYGIFKDQYSATMMAKQLNRLSKQIKNLSKKTCQFDLNSFDCRIFFVPLNR